MWKKIVRWLRTYIKERNWATFALFVVVAALLWWGHASNSVRERDIRVRVNYVGIPDNIAFSKPLPKTLTIRLRDEGKRLAHYQAELQSGISLDLSANVWQKEGEIHIAHEQIRAILNDRFQGTARVQAVTPESIDGVYAQQEEKQVPVRVRAELKPAKQYDFTAPYRIFPETLHIYGTPDLLDSVQYIETEVIVLQELKASATVKAAIVLPEGLRADKDSISLQYFVEQYTENMFEQVPIQVDNLPESEQFITFPAYAKVVVSVPTSKFQAVTADMVRVYCTYPSVPCEALPVQLEIKSPYVLHSRVEPQEVQYFIQ